MNDAKVTSASVLLLLLNYSPATADSCRTRLLDKPPSWISTVVLDSSDVLISDPRNSELLSYNVISHTTNTHQIPGSSAVTRISGGFLIQGQDEVVILSPDKKLVASPEFSHGKAERTGLGSLYSNWATRGAIFVGYGSVRNSLNLSNGGSDQGRGFSLGFIKGHVNATTGFSDIELLEANDNNSLYLFGLPYFAANDTGLFFVRMVGRSASIQRVKEDARSGTEEVRAFPEEFREVPQIKTPSRGVTTTAKRFEEIEKQKMAAGLFGQGSLLYLLTRQPARTGDSTDWWLYQIDPKESKPRGVVRLPTKAKHLSVVPGPTSWYLIERGNVQGWGVQEIKTIVEVPGEWITAPESSPLNLGSLQVTQCPVR